MSYFLYSLPLSPPASFFFAPLNYVYLSPPLPPSQLLPLRLISDAVY